MAVLPKPPNADLKKGFTDAQLAEKHGWPDPIWSDLWPWKAKLIMADSRSLDEDYLKLL